MKATRDEPIGTAAAAAMALCVLLAAPPCEADPIARESVALIIEKNGPISPDVQPYSEVLAGDALKVPDGSSLVFIDYRSCNRVTVSGRSMGRDVGPSVSFSSTGYETSPGAKRREQRIACPQRLAPESGGENSSLLMRGGDGLQSIAVRPTFVIVSANSRRFVRMNLKDGTRTLLDTELRGARFDWPSSSPPLEPGVVYHLVLLPEPGGDRPLSLSFRAAAPSADTRDAIVVIHAD